VKILCEHAMHPQGLWRARHVMLKLILMMTLEYNSKPCLSSLSYSLLYSFFFFLFIYLLFKVYFIVVSRPSPYLESCKKTKHPRLDYINHNYFWKPGLKLSKKQRINEELHPHRIIVSCTKISIRISINNLFIIILPSYHG